MIGQTLKQAAMPFEADTGIRVDGLHPRIPMDLSDEWCDEFGRCFHNVGMAGKWPRRAGTAIFLICKNVFHRLVAHGYPMVEV